VGGKYFEGLMSVSNVELIDHIRRELGDPIVEVELDNTQIQRSIDQALRRWARRFPTERITTIEVTSGVMQYDIASLIGSTIRGIIDVVEEPYDSDVIADQEYQYYYRNPIYGVPIIEGGDIALTKSYVNDLNIVTSNTFEWDFNEASNLLHISPSPSRAYTLMIRYTDNPTVEEATRQYDWVIEYALADAKEILGRIRRKHANSVQGKEFNFQLDGGELVSEGKEDKRDLMELLERMGGDQTPPLVG